MVYDAIYSLCCSGGFAFENAVQSAYAAPREKEEPLAGCFTECAQYLRFIAAKLIRYPFDLVSHTAESVRPYLPYAGERDLATLDARDHRGDLLGTVQGLPEPVTASRCPTVLAQPRTTARARQGTWEAVAAC